MTGATLALTAARLCGPGKGLLAIDESPHTCNRRFAAAGIAQTEAMRRSYRELLLTTPGLGEHLNGVIICDETLHQRTLSGTSFLDVLAAAGVLAGIKVDAGAKPLAGHPGELVTEGLDGLRERLTAYAGRGASFAKWRAVIGGGTPERPWPSGACIQANAHALSRYAALCQEAGLVPIVEPEVMMTGTHTRQHCAQVTRAVQECVFEQLVRQGVALEQMILKPNMVLAGLDCPTPDTAMEVAESSIECLLRTVPAAVPGIAFLSGGQSDRAATSRLNAMKLWTDSADGRSVPWALTFSFGRALQRPALAAWGGRDEGRAQAQQALLRRLQFNRAALLGTYEAGTDPA